MKKIFYIPILFIIFFLISCGNKEESEIFEPDFSIDGKASYYNNKEYEISYTGSLKTLITYDNTIYHNDLARLSINLSTAINTSFIVDDERISLTEMLEKNGFEQITIFNNKLCETDPYDDNRFLMAYKELSYKDKDYDLFFIISAGTGYSNGNWISNFDVGYDGEDYYKLKGNNHPDWIDKNNHKGFEVASNRILNIINDYIYTNKKNDDVILFNTGHSRGGAIASLVGYKLEKTTDYKLFTYAFASPNYTSNEDECNTVFNILNKQDLVVNCLPDYVGLKRYGKSIYYDYDDISEILDELGIEYTVLEIDKIVNLLSKILKSRDTFYDVDCLTKVYAECDSKSQAENKILEIDNSIGDLKEYCHYFIDENNNVIFNCATDFIVELGVKIFTSDNKMSLVTNYLPFLPITMSDALNAISPNIMDGIVDNHNYYGYYAFTLKN